MNLTSNRRVPMKRDECPRLLSLAVHEFRTPVTVVAGYLRMLLKMQPTLGDQPRKLIEEAEKSVGRLTALIAELSELTNVEAGQISLDRHDVDLCGLLAEVAETVHEGRDRDVCLELQPAAEHPIVVADRKYLARALETLLAATLRERALPGVIVASCRVLPREGRPVAAVLMSARDEGGGQAPFDEAEWAPFEQWRGGLGFRLVLAEQLIAAHGGTLYSGRGARARAACALVLPVKETQ